MARRTRATTLRIRELRIEVRTPGFRVDEIVLVTTLLDPLAYPKEEGGVALLLEVGHRARPAVYQNYHATGCVAMRDTEMVEKGSGMHGLAYNLIRGLMAAAAHGRLPREISFKGTLQALEAFRNILEFAPRRNSSRIAEGADSDDCVSMRRRSSESSLSLASRSSDVPNRMLCCCNHVGWHVSNY